MRKIKGFSIVLVMMLSACAHITEQKKLEHLDAKQKLFMKALRWKSYETAASVIRFRNPARQLGPIDGLNKITVTSYDLLGSAPHADDGSVVAQAFKMIRAAFIKLSTLKFGGLMRNQSNGF